MSHKPNIVAIIPARGGSKGIPGKNIKLLNGKPLIAYSIEAAKSASSISAVYVSTDSPEIASVARKYGALVIDRPKELATDTATSESVLLHFAEQVDSDAIVFLQCTTPLTNSKDIDGAVKLLEKGYDSVLSVSENHGGFLCGGFLWNGKGESVNFDYKNRPRRQDREKTFLENGAIYVMRKQGLRSANNRLYGKIGLHVMPMTRSLEIDAPVDFAFAEVMLQHGGHLNEA